MISPLRMLAGLIAIPIMGIACAKEPQPPLLRLAELVEASFSEEASDVELVSNLGVGADPVTVAIDLDAARIVRLSLSARGDSPMLEMSWRLANEGRFKPYRKLSLPLQPDGEERRYEIDLAREPYWTARVADLRFSALEGGVEIVSLTGTGSAAGPRTTALKGVSVPSLPGLERIEIELPEGLPEGTIFETRMGILPKLARPGTSARFRAYLRPVPGPMQDQVPDQVPDQTPGRLFLDRTLSGGSAEGWREVRVDLPSDGGEILILDVSASRRGEALAEGSAVWGGPRLVPPPSSALGAFWDNPAGSSPRRVILMAIDTLRADSVGAFGGREVATPNLDALAAESVRFDELLAPAPWTLPSVASLITGFQPQSHGTGRSFGKYAPSALGPAPPTLAQVLSRSGFYSVAVYNNIYLNPSFGLDRGFDEYIWIEEEDDVLVDRALELLERYDDRPLFLFLHLFGPHNPYDARAADCAGVARAREPGYEGALGCTADRRPGLPVPPAGDWSWIEALYQADVAFTDRQVGRLLESLESAAGEDRTILAVVSDHGEDFWGRLEEMQDRGYEDADHGHSLYRELLRVPGLIRAPGLAPRRVGEPVELVDFFPTILGLLGLESPLTDGRDLAPLLRGERSPRRTVLSDVLLYGPPRWAIRRGPWKLIVAEDKDLARELYNLDDDPGETRDLAGERPDLVASLLEFGERERARREAVRRELQKGEDALQAAYLEWNHITKLRSLGYLQ